MTSFIEEAERLLRLARRDYQTCAILGSHPEARELQRLTPFAVELRYDEGIPLLTRKEAEQLATRTLAWAEATVAGAANQAN